MMATNVGYMAIGNHSYATLSPLERVVMTSLAAPQQCGQFLPDVRMKAMGRIQDDFADRIGRRVAVVFLTLLFALFAYGYLWPLIY